MTVTNFTIAGVHKEIRYLIGTANQVTGLCMKLQDWAEMGETTVYW